MSKKRMPVSIRDSSFFSNSNLPLSKVIRILHLWSTKTSLGDMMKEVGVRNLNDCSAQLDYYVLLIVCYSYCCRLVQLHTRCMCPIFHWPPGKNRRTRGRSGDWWVQVWSTKVSQREDGRGSLGIWWDRADNRKVFPHWSRQEGCANFTPNHTSVQAVLFIVMSGGLTLV